MLFVCETSSHLYFRLTHNKHCTVAHLTCTVVQMYSYLNKISLRRDRSMSDFEYSTTPSYRTEKLHRGKLVRQETAISSTGKPRDFSRNIHYCLFVCGHVHSSHLYVELKHNLIVFKTFNTHSVDSFINSDS